MFLQPMGTMAVFLYFSGRTTAESAIVSRACAAACASVVAISTLGTGSPTVCTTARPVPAQGRKNRQGSPSGNCP